MKERNNKRFVSGAEKRFRGIMSRLYTMKANRVVFTKKQEVEVAHAINEIEKYGFNFFANHYIMDKVDQLEKMINVYEKEATA